MRALFSCVRIYAVRASTAVATPADPDEANFIVGLLSVEKSITEDELRDSLFEIRPPRLHFLGAASTRTLEPRLRIVAEIGLTPEYISADANILRSALYGKIGGNRWAAIRQTLIERSPVLLT